MSRDALLGIDIGTTGSKALLVDRTGAILGSATTEYPLSTPQPLWCEQDPHDWWRATVTSVRRACEQARVDPARIVAVGLTGQMHGLTLLNAHGAVLRPAILWNDQRTAVECREITQRVGERRVLELTGNAVLPGFTAPKLAWVRRHEPHVLARTAKFLLPKDYVRYRLTGECFTDVADASGTSLFDVGRRTWSDEMRAALDIPPSWLPQVTESCVASTTVSAAAAAETGLVAGTPVAAGAGDQAAQAVGTGVIAEGLVSATIGTSGVVFAACDQYRPEPQGRLHAFCHAVPGQWHLMGVMLAAGGSLRWYRDTLCEAERQAAAASGRDAYDLLCDAAADVAPGCEGLIFLPYLSGERTPHVNPHARGVFFGLSLRHTKAHLTRAVLEGVSFGLCDAVDLLRAMGVGVTQVCASGGGARSALWRQVLADVFECRLVTVNATEGAAFGAALLAGVGAGVFPDVATACRATLRETGACVPGPATPHYRVARERFRALYPALVGEFARLETP